MSAPWDAIVLAGGRASRLGGLDKATLEVGGATLLDRTLAAVGGAARVVVVGEVAAPGAVVVREDPPFSGPAAAIGAGLAHVTAGRVLVVAVDVPFVADVVPRLVAADPGTSDGVVATVGGRRQHLLTVVDTTALRRAADAPPTLVDLAARSLLAPLRLVEVEVPAGAALDVDTWHDREQAEADVAARRVEEVRDG